jgi:osmotically-inducible protein OsmY
VTGITNSIDVEYHADRPDSEMKREISEILKWDIFVPNDAFIDVDVNDGQVTLSGTVGSLSEKTRAYSKAWVAGVTSVDDSKLDVEGWAADRKTRNDPYADVSDGEIRDAVIDAMLYDPHVNSFNVTAEVTNGAVTLRGEVNNLRAKREAARNARNTVGVHSVKNRLKVRIEEGFPTDEQIQERIDDALIRNPYVQSYEITPVVNNGLVDLYGTVDSFFEKSQAEEAVANVKGTVAVDNNIIVTNSTAPYVYDPAVDEFEYDYDWNLYESANHLKLDSEIKDDIQSELFWSPFVDSDQVTVAVDDGTATLTGTVDSWSERQSAEENAMEGGADAVINKLTVN